MKQIGIVIGIFWLMLMGAVPVKAEVSCTANFSPEKFPPNADGLAIEVEISNTGSEPLRWLKIWNPFGSDMFVRYPSLAGWGRYSDAEAVEYSGGSLAAGESITVAMTMSLGEVSPGNAWWAVDVSPTSWGETEVTACEGELYSLIDPETKVAPPVCTPDSGDDGLAAGVVAEVKGAIGRKLGAWGQWLKRFMIICRVEKREGEWQVECW